MAAGRWMFCSSMASIRYSPSGALASSSMVYAAVPLALVRRPMSSIVCCCGSVTVRIMRVLGDGFSSSSSASTVMMTCSPWRYICLSVDRISVGGVRGFWALAVANRVMAVRMAATALITLDGWLALF